MIAFQKRFPNVAILLDSSLNEYYTLLHIFCFRNASYEEFSSILQYKPIVDMINNTFNGLTPLMILSKFSKTPNRIELLIKYGADIHTTIFDPYQKTHINAIGYANLYKNDTIVDYLSNVCV